MHCLDASALVDYLHGVDDVGVFIEEHGAEPLFAPTVALHETFVAAVRTRGAQGLEQAQEDLDWIEPMPLSVDGAAEAARVDAELHAAGRPIGALDTLIAGVIRAAGGTVVTRDPHFDRVEGLDVIQYDS